MLSSNKNASGAAGATTRTVRIHETPSHATTATTSTTTAAAAATNTLQRNHHNNISTTATATATTRQQQLHMLLGSAATAKTTAKQQRKGADDDAAAAAGASSSASPGMNALDADNAIIERGSIVLLKSDIVLLQNEIDARTGEGGIVMLQKRLSQFNWLPDLSANAHTVVQLHELILSKITEVSQVCQISLASESHAAKTSAAASGIFASPKQSRVADVISLFHSLRDQKQRDAVEKNRMLLALQQFSEGNSEDANALLQQIHQGAVDSSNSNHNAANSVSPIRKLEAAVLHDALAGGASSQQQQQQSKMLGSTSLAGTLTMAGTMNSNFFLASTAAGSLAGLGLGGTFSDLGATATTTIQRRLSVGSTNQPQQQQQHGVDRHLLRKVNTPAILSPILHGGAGSHTGASAVVRPHSVSEASHVVLDHMSTPLHHQQQQQQRSAQQQQQNDAHSRQLQQQCVSPDPALPTLLQRQQEEEEEDENDEDEFPQPQRQEQKPHARGSSPREDAPSLPLSQQQQPTQQQQQQQQQQTKANKSPAQPSSLAIRPLENQVRLLQTKLSLFQYLERTLHDIDAVNTTWTLASDPALGALGIDMEEILRAQNVQVPSFVRKQSVMLSSPGLLASSSASGTTTAAPRGGRKSKSSAFGAELEQQTAAATISTISNTQLEAHVDANPSAAAPVAQELQRQQREFSNLVSFQNALVMALVDRVSDQESAHKLEMQKAERRMRQMERAIDAQSDTARKDRLRHSILHERAAIELVQERASSLSRLSTPAGSIVPPGSSLPIQTRFFSNLGSRPNSSMDGAGYLFDGSASTVVAAAAGLGGNYESINLMNVACTDLDGGGGGGARGLGSSGLSSRIQTPAAGAMRPQQQQQQQQQQHGRAKPHIATSLRELDGEVEKEYLRTIKAQQDIIDDLRGGRRQQRQPQPQQHA